MDTLSMRFGVVQRSAGGDARSMAAYQMCSRLTAGDRQLDFTRKSKEHQGRLMLMPSGAPSWAQEPQQLWDRAEASERRGDAQSARLLEFSIPRAVPDADRLDFVRHVLAPFVADGMGVQADLHNKLASDGAEHPHCHAMLTLRRFEGGDFAKKKSREWNTDFRDNQGKAIRERIAGQMNGWMKDHGILARVDHRSFADRGITSEPEGDAPRRAWKAHQADPESPAAAPVRQVLAEREQRTTARRDVTWEAARAEYAGAAAAHYAAEKERRQAAYTERRQAEQAVQGELRTRQRDERSRVYQTTQRGMLRTIALSFQGSRHTRQSAVLDVEAQAARMTADTSGDAFPDFDTWLDDKVAAGDPNAKAAQAQRSSRRAWLAKKDPPEAARRAVADIERAANRVLRGRPRGSVDDDTLFVSARNKVTERRDGATAAARQAAETVQQHRRTASTWKRLTDAGWRREHVQLMAAAGAAQVKANSVATRYEGNLNTARQTAHMAASQHRDTLKTWLARPDVRAAQTTLDTARVVRAAIEAGDERTIKAAATGTPFEGAQAARTWQEQQAAKVEAQASPARHKTDQQEAIKQAQERASEARRIAAAQRAAATPTPDSAAPAPSYRRR